MPHTTGLLSRHGVLAAEDAPPVALLKRAGAIPLGVTNTSELCMWSESNNNLYGITNNPYDFPLISMGVIAVPSIDDKAELDATDVSERYHFICLTVTVHCSYISSF